MSFLCLLIFFFFFFLAEPSAYKSSQVQDQTRAIAAPMPNPYPLGHQGPPVLLPFYTQHAGLTFLALFRPSFWGGLASPLLLCFGCSCCTEWDVR